MVWPGGGGGHGAGHSAGTEQAGSVLRAPGTQRNDEVCTSKDHRSFCIENIPGQLINLLGLPWPRATHWIAWDTGNAQRGVTAHHTTLHTWMVLRE